MDKAKELKHQLNRLSRLTDRMIEANNHRTTPTTREVLDEVLREFDKQLAESEMPNVYEKGALVILERIIAKQLEKAGLEIGTARSGFIKI